MNIELQQIFSITNQAMTITADRARVGVLDIDLDPIEQITNSEEFLREKFSEIGLTLSEAVDLATSYVEEEENYDLMEAANFLQFFV